MANEAYNRVGPSGEAREELEKLEEKQNPTSQEQDKIAWLRNLVPDLKLHLQRNEILTVWFNAWRYEREDQFAIIALVKTIGFAMSKHPIYKELKPILLNAVKIIGKSLLSEIASNYIGEKA